MYGKAYLGGGNTTSVVVDNADAALSGTGSVLVGRTGGAGAGIFAEAGHLVLQPRSNAADRDIIFLDGGGNENMIIEDGGNVGIGVIDPDAQLEVAGMIKGQHIIMDAETSGLSLSCGFTPGA